MVLGADGKLAARLSQNLRRGGFRGTIWDAAVGPDGGVRYAEARSPARPPDLAVLCQGGGPPEVVMPALARAGIFASVVIAAVSAPGALRVLAERTGVRSLGPDSFGLAVPSIGLDATLGHLPPRPGRVALVSQSSALCRTVLDWAAPTGVGFSHIVGVGFNDDIGDALVLDWLGRDPGTGAILLDIRRLRDARLFLSAARAAARLRPVVAIRGGSRAADASGTMEATLAAALHRVGVVCVDRLEDFLAAAETLTRVKPARGDRLAIVSNAIGPARMAADAALRDGVELATEEPVHAELPDLAAAARRATEQGAGAVLLVHAPEGEDDAAAMAEVAAEAGAHGLPWLVCALGEATAAERRRLLGAAGVPAFAGPEGAVRAFAYLVQDRRGRAAAAELPPSDLLDVRPDRAAVTEALGRADLPAVLRQYGVTPVGGPSGVLRLMVASDPLFGPFLSLGSALTLDQRDQVVELPPLNLRLADAAVRRGALARGLIAEWGEAFARDLVAVLVRVSALLVDRADILSLRFDPCAPETGEVALHPPGATPPRLALPPYPSELVSGFDARGERLTVRPIRPEDADAHAAMFRRLPPDDVRRRFFVTLRELPVEQIVRMTEIDYEREMAFVAVRRAADGGSETVGVARLSRQTLRNEGEFAVVVQPDMKGTGLARYLMQRLIAWGRAQGLDAIVGDVLAENHPMRSFVTKLGFTVRMLPDETDVVEARLSLREVA